MKEDNLSNSLLVKVKKQRDFANEKLVWAAITKL